MPVTLKSPYKSLLTDLASERAFVLMSSHLMCVESTGSGKLLWTEIALESHRRLLDMGELPRKSVGVRVILVHVLFEFFFGAPADIHSCTSHFGAAKRFFVPVRVLLKTSVVGEPFVEIEASMSRAFVPILSIEVR